MPNKTVKLESTNEKLLEEVRNANKGKETEIKKAIKEALKWKNAKVKKPKQP